MPGFFERVSPQTYAPEFVQSQAPVAAPEQFAAAPAVQVINTGDNGAGAALGAVGAAVAGVAADQAKAAATADLAQRKIQLATGVNQIGIELNGIDEATGQPVPDGSGKRLNIAGARQRYDELRAKVGYTDPEIHAKMDEILLGYSKEQAGHFRTVAEQLRKGREDAETASVRSRVLTDPAQYANINNGDYANQVGDREYKDARARGLDEQSAVGIRTGAINAAIEARHGSDAARANQTQDNYLITRLDELAAQGVVGPVAENQIAVEMRSKFGNDAPNRAVLSARDPIFRNELLQKNTNAATESQMDAALVRAGGDTDLAIKMMGTDSKAVMEAAKYQGSDPGKQKLKEAAKLIFTNQFKMVEKSNEYRTIENTIALLEKPILNKEERALVDQSLTTFNSGLWLKYNVDVANQRAQVLEGLRQRRTSLHSEADELVRQTGGNLQSFDYYVANRVKRERPVFGPAAPTQSAEQNYMDKNVPSSSVQQTQQHSALSKTRPWLSRPLYDGLSAVATKYFGNDPTMIHALVGIAQQESSGRLHPNGGNGGGMFQILTDTHADIWRAVGVPKGGENNASLEQQVQAVDLYLRKTIKEGAKIPDAGALAAAWFYPASLKTGGSYRDYRLTGNDARKNPTIKTVGVYVDGVLAKAGLNSGTFAALPEQRKSRIRSA